MLRNTIGRRGVEGKGGGLGRRYVAVNLPEVLGQYLSAYDSKASVSMLDMQGQGERAAILGC